MISRITSNPSFNKVVISTGNILTVNNKLGRQSHEEVVDGLKLTLLCDISNQVELNENEGQVLRATEELNQKLTEHGRSEINIGAKLFLNKSSSVYIEESVNAMLQTLKVDEVDNLILAYHPQPSKEAVTNGLVDVSDGGTITWSSHNKQAMNELKQLWNTLEEFALRKQIKQLGISDLDLEALSELHAAARVKPTIAQVNLATCCVVPPPLQEFCAKHDIRLVTHSDPEILLPDDEFLIPNYTVDWTLRYQVHVRCRGVLAAKGYILGARKQ